MREGNLGKMSQFPSLAGVRMRHLRPSTLHPAVSPDAQTEARGQYCGRDPLQAVSGDVQAHAELQETRRSRPRVQTARVRAMRQDLQTPGIKLVSHQILRLESLETSNKFSLILQHGV